MKINKDLTDALLMISFITLVLVGTSDFDNPVLRSTLMIFLGTVSLGMVILRVVEARQNKDEDNNHH